MSAFDEFVEKIHQTDTMQELERSLDEEPAWLLARICEKYQKTEHPVPDHYLQTTGYFGETMLNVLIRAGMIVRQSSARNSLFEYEPTAAGLELQTRIMKEKAE
ncbi:MAG: hypothetical protein KAQ74_04420 [Dehalococcoidia bacterium]|nr:hypothetical protein [Dehalococcoidia bacterium]